MPVRLIADEEPLPGYRLIERLGRGGFGEVWKVEAPGGLLKAMKFVFGDLNAEDEDSRPAMQELKALKRVQTIRHPYVLSLERYDILEGQLIITMELADENLWDRFRTCRGQGHTGVPRDELLRYMEETAEALDLMNNYYQIQHLDVKPQNLFVVFNHVKVGDFGLAKLLEGVRATVTGGVTPVYAAPETFEGYVSRFSDQYSLAIVFQELLTGTRPFNGSNTRQLLMQHINGTPELQALPPSDRAIIGRGLSKKPTDRWPNCTDMVRALRQSGLPSTAPVAAGHAGGGHPPSAEASAATRVQVGGSGRLGPDPTSGLSRNQTPQPGSALSGQYSGSYPQPGSSLAGQYSGSRPPATPGSGSNSTPMPPLVTAGAGGMPRLVTASKSAAGLTPAHTLTRPPVFQTGLMHGLGIAPPEKLGDGELFPALVVAVGHTGRVVVEQLRRAVGDRYGGTDQVPNVRFLLIDTDPEAGSPTAGAPADAPGFTARDTVVVRLNRPGHYLQRDALPPVEGWLPPGALYKLPRNPGPAGGVRAFGRLALLDHYRPVAQRVRQEVETFLSDDHLAKAAKATGLALRTNRPRVYIVAGLGGGTGGGMFLDLAFLVRQELRAVGYIRPEVAGVFLVPPADKAAYRNAALGNAHAALAELYHFQARRTKYQLTFDKAEAPVADADAPFARVALLQLPKTADPKGRADVAGRAARALFNELLTPAGRVADEVRDVYRNAFPSYTPTCQSFGLFRLTWPRPEVLTAATRLFAQRLLHGWMGKDAAALREPIRVWLEGQWEDRKLGFEQLVEGYQAVARKALREDPDKVFDAFVDPLRTRTPSGSKLDAAAACSVLEQLIKVVGKPPGEDDQTEGSMAEPLAARFREVAKEAEGQLAFMAVTFIEQPQYRLAGAEEAVRQIEDRLKRQIEVLEPTHHDLDQDVRQVYGRALQAIGGLSAGGGMGWKGGATADAIDLLRAYPRKRHQLRVLDLCLSTYRKMLVSMPEYLREIGGCRVGLAEMHAALAAPAGGPAASIGPGKLILPDGCQTLDDAADRFLAGINPGDVLGFDQAVQKEASRKFRGLAAVCLKAATKGPPFRDLLLAKARAFLDAKLDAADPATVFFRNRTGTHADHPLIGEAFGEAEPDVKPVAGGSRPDEALILAVPPGADGDRFRRFVAEVLPGVEFTPAPLPDDIMFYREFPRLELSSLPHLGEYARAAADALAAADHPIHSRTDVAWTAPTGP